MRTRPGGGEPEVYFRIVHAALNSQNSAPVAAYREQTVEIALGPKGAFENGNIGALTRRLATNRGVRAAPLHRGNPKPSKVAKTPRVTQVMGLLRLGPEIQKKILSLPDTTHRPPISERILRPLETSTDRFDQIQ